MNKLKIHKKFILITIVFLMVVLSTVINVQAQNLDILDIEVNDIDGKTVEIKWGTNTETQGKVIFGESSDNLPHYIIDNTGASVYHNVKLGNLKEKTTYYYQIIVYDDNEQTQSFIKNFKTEEFHDEIPPKISNVQIPHKAGTAAVVNWETDKKATSKVEYDKNETYTKSTGSNSKVNSHMVILKNLAPNTQYFLRIYSVDKDNNKSSYTYKEFTTRESDEVDKEDLIISHLRPAGPDDSYISTGSIKVSFKTNHYAKGKITLKKKGLKTQTKNLDYGLEHSAIFSGLLSENEYNVEISMNDIFNKKAKEKFTVLTKKVAISSDEEVSENNINNTVLGGEYSYYTPATALYKAEGSHRVYSIINNKRHYITSPNSFGKYGYSWRSVKIISKEKLLKIPRVKLVKSPEDVTIYYLYERPENKLLKIAIPSPSVFLSYPNNSWADVVKITQSDIDNISDVKLVKTKDNPNVYYLENGVKHYVSETVFVSRGFNWGEITEVNQVHLDSYQTGNPLS
jgi:hypothetical protein